MLHMLKVLKINVFKVSICHIVTLSVASLQTYCMTFLKVLYLLNCLCLKNFNSKGYITLDRLNSLTNSFPYKYSDRVNKPKTISKANVKKGEHSWQWPRKLVFITIFPSSHWKEFARTRTCMGWTVLMDLKEIVKIVVSSVLSEEILQYLEIKLSDHRSLLTDTFPAFSLHLKHHFADHYPNLLHCFGPLAELWTMRFESNASTASSKRLCMMFKTLKMYSSRR